MSVEVCRFCRLSALSCSFLFIFEYFHFTPPATHRRVVLSLRSIFDLSFEKSNPSAYVFSLPSRTDNSIKSDCIFSCCLFYIDCRRALFPSFRRDAQLSCWKSSRLGCQWTWIGRTLPPRTRGLQYRERHCRSSSSFWCCRRHWFDLFHPESGREIRSRSWDQTGTDFSMETEGSFADPSESPGHCRSSLARSTFVRRSIQRLFGHLGSRRRWIERSPVHGRYIGDALLVARHRLSHPSGFGDGHLGRHSNALGPFDHRYSQGTRRSVGRIETAGRCPADRPSANIVGQQ